MVEPYLARCLFSAWIANSKTDVESTRRPKIITKRLNSYIRSIMEFDRKMLNFAFEQIKIKTHSGGI